MAAAAPPARKLPIWSPVKAAYKDTLNNLPTVLRAGWLWIALIILFEAASVVFAGGSLVDQTESTGAALGLQLAAALVLLLASVAIAATWHRRLLTGMVPPRLGAPLDGPALRYGGRFLLIMLTVGVIAGLATLFLVLAGTMMAGAQGSESFAEGVGSAVAALAALLSLFVFARLQLSLPAAALSQDASFGKAFELSRGNTLRLVIGLLVQMLIAIPISILLFAVLMPLAATGLEVAFSIISNLFNLFFIVVGTAWLSFAYRYLTTGSLEPAAR